MIDAHVHLWDPSKRDYPWLDPSSAIGRPFTLGDLETASAETDFEAAILVQTLACQEETADFLATAERSHLIAGVVGWVDLLSDHVRESITRLRDGPGGVKLVGIRHQAEDEDDPGWLLRPTVVRGVSEVFEAGLAFDLLVREREMPAAIRLVEHLRGGRFVLDHVAKPRVAVGAIEPWASYLTDLADHPEVACKLSGLVTEAGPWWREAAIARYAEHAISLFGSSRLMFGSDWPVCQVVASYREVAALAVGILAPLPATQRLQVMTETACHWYGLDCHSSPKG